MAKKEVVTRYYAMWFPIYLFIIQITGIIFMALVFLIVVLYLHGYEYYFADRRGRNLHMILAPLAFVYLSGQGMLLFRLMKNMRTQFVKTIHTLIHTLSFLIGILAIYAMWNGKENPMNPYITYKNTPTVFPRPTKYTPLPVKNLSHFAGLHSYLGYLSLICFMAVYFFGVFLYLLEVDMYYKDACSGFHGYLGTLALIVAAMTSVCGISTVFNDRRYFWFARYMEKQGEYTVGFYCCLSGLLFSYCILYVILNPQFEWLPIGPI